MEEIILDDLFKIYLSSIDSYNSKILQTINEKYTIVDQAMLAVYLYIKILEDRGEKDSIAIETLSNYLLKQIIYGETGNLALEITDKSKLDFYHKVIDTPAHTVFLQMQTYHHKAICVLFLFVFYSQLYCQMEDQYKSSQSVHGSP